MYFEIRGPLITSIAEHTMLYVLSAVCTLSRSSSSSTVCFGGCVSKSLVGKLNTPYSVSTGGSMLKDAKDLSFSISSLG